MSADGTPNPETARLCRDLMAKLPASLEGRPLPGDAKWRFELTQRDVDVLFAALSHHAEFCATGYHEDALDTDPDEILARLDRVEAALATLADDGKAAMRRLMPRLAMKPIPGEKLFDPYADLPPDAREFAENLDLWTLKEVVVRAMTEIDRRRRKYLGGVAKMADRAAEKAATDG